METKTFNKFQIAMIKNVAKLTSKNLANKEKLLRQIADLQHRLEIEQKCIDGFQTPVKELTGGYTTEDLVSRVVEKTGQVDPSTGKEHTVTKFVLKYPETVIPPVVEDETNPEIPSEETLAVGDNESVSDPFNDNI